MRRVIVVGGGASGLVAAIFASRNGNDVTILEKNNNIGKKILITGAGKCNYWHDDIDIKHYRSDDISFLNNIITEDNKKEILDFFNSIGIVPRTKNGYYYPYSNVAVSVQNAFLLELRRLNIKVITNCEVEDISKNEVFTIKTNNGIYTCDDIIISTGSCACPKTGSNGEGYNILTKLGHSMIKPLPALVQLIGKESYFKDWAGIRSDACVSLYENDKFITSETGEIQFTDYGVSGICIMNLSGRISKGLDINKKEEVRFDLVPFVDDFIRYMNNRNSKLANRNIIELLESIINYKLLYVILKVSKIDTNKTWNELNNSQKETLKNNIKSFNLKILNTKGFDNAQVVTGGIKLLEVDSNLQSNIVKNLYIVGELLDVDGDCGGYNLGFAWLSGMVAGRNIK